jgi:hypothetical protein
MQLLGINFNYYIILGESREVKDIKFKTSFIMIIGFLKTLNFTIPIFFEQSENSQLVSNIISDAAVVLVILLWAFLKSKMSTNEFLKEPCNISEFNLWRALPFAGGLLIGISLISGLEYFLMILLLPLLIGVLVWTIYRKRTHTKLSNEVIRTA